MHYRDIVITPPPEDARQYYRSGCRTYFAYRYDGVTTLHPLDGHTANKRTGDLISISVALGSADPRKRGVREISAAPLLRGDIIETQWPPSQDAERLRWLGEWRYSSLANEEITSNTLPTYRPVIS